ncbi:hypothetical protein [Kineosporia sp. A_224]|uniref:hypothetical protein n=1 Tax=Kineosporia sp. A_224 TaxID=1962180 RepID=UPI000B4AA814|nr:hypothetical protein [Kineosporia sp. A_224]
MATYRWHESGFITQVAAHRGGRVDGGAGSDWRLHGGGDGLRWVVTLTPASGEAGPRIVWRTTDLKAGDDDRRQLVVGRSNPGGTSFGDLEGGLLGAAFAAGMLAVGGLLRHRRGAQAPPGGASTAPTDDQAPESVLGAGWSVLDPSGVLDAGLAPLFGTWPVAWWGPGDERPAGIDRVWLTQTGLEVTASEWWCSAPALDQLVGLGVEVAHRLRRAGFG